MAYAKVKHTVKKSAQLYAKVNKTTLFDFDVNIVVDTRFTCST
jgi:hypothetical protein